MPPISAYDLRRAIVDVKGEKISAYARGIPSEDRSLGRCPPILGSGLQFDLLQEVRELEAGVRRLTAASCVVTESRRAVALSRRSEHVFEQTAQDALVKPEGPGDTVQKPRCNSTCGGRLKNAVQSPLLGLRRERRLHHSPTVVAGGSMDCGCTGTKGPRDSVWCTA